MRDGREETAVEGTGVDLPGAVHDRDHNAAKDILAAGQGDRLNDCGVPCQNPFRRGLRSSNPPLCHTTPHGMGSEEEPGRIER